MHPSDPRSAVHAELGTYPPTGLIDARKQLHHALQLVASAGRSFADKLPDDAHANLGWMPELHALVTRPLGALEKKPRVALRLDRPAVMIFDDDVSCVQLPLTGRVRTEVAGWLRSQLALRDLQAARYLLDRPYEIPHHPVVDGVRYFAPDDVAQGTPGELARWFELVTPALEAVRERETVASPLASEVRCWPHHFDIATLITLDPDREPGESRTVGVGMSPGDEDIEQPYVYVTPWPEPEPDAHLPDLPLGRWQTKAWTGAVLTGEELLAAEGATPAEHLTAFLDAAIPAVRTLPGPVPKPKKRKKDR
jgi:hypothetical protein